MISSMMNFLLLSLGKGWSFAESVWRVGDFANIMVGMNLLGSAGFSVIRSVVRSVLLL